ncbi:MAG: response regulator [Deltaproteobacteria bacterium]|nr:response regulator [Deltaproteobacteria bacterium]
MPEPRRLLLIDDDEDLRDSMTEALQGAGFVVSSAANGRDALDQLTAEKDLPDVILLDLLMPVMNGWQFCDERKRNPKLADIPVIVMSAAVSKDPWSPYYLDVDDFVAKPVELDDLVGKLATFTNGPVEARRARR